MKNPNELRSILISKRVFIFLLTAIVAVFPLFLVGCAPYNATIVSGENLFEATPEWKERASNIHIRETYDYNPDYDPEYDPLKDENEENANKKELFIYYGNEYPKDLIIVVNTQEELDSMYTTHPQIDMEKKMLIVYFYQSSDNGVYKSKIKKIEFENGKMNIYFVSRSPRSFFDASPRPHRTSIMVLMDKVDYKEIGFKRLYDLWSVYGF